MAAAVLTIDINARLASLEQAFNDVKRQASKFSVGVIDELKKVSSFGDLLKLSLGGVAAGFTLDKVKSELLEMRELAIQAERSVTQLQTALKTTGGSSGLTSGQLESINKDLQGSSIFDDQQIRAAETALLRFRTIQGDTFKQAIALAPDVAAALGTDLVSAAQALGRAISQPESGMRALRAAGINLSDTQRVLAANMREAGDVAGSQQLAIDAIAKSVGGASEADNTGLFGATKRAERAWNDLKKTLGQQAPGSSALLDFETKVLEGISDKIKNVRTEHAGLLAALEAIPSIIAPGAFNVPAVVGALTIPRASKAEEEKREAAALDEQSKQRVAQANAAAAAAQDAADRQSLQAFEQLKRRSAASASFYASELAVQKSFLATQQSDLQFGYDRGTVATTQYYEGLAAIARRNLRIVEDNTAQQGKAAESIIANPLANKADQETAFSQLRQLATAQDQARLTLAERLQTLQQQEITSVERLKDEYTSLGAKVQESLGNTSGAVAANFDVQNRELRRRLQSQQTASLGTGDTSGFAEATNAITQLDTLRKLTVAQAQLNDANRAFARTLDDISIQQERIDLAQQRGDITSIEQLQRKSDLNKAYIGDLQRQADALEVVAKSTGNEDAIQGVKRLRLEIERLASQTDLLGDKFRGVFVDGFTDALTNIATGAKSVKDALLDLAKSLEQSLARIAAQNVSEQLFGKGGALGGVSDIVAKIFGGKGVLGGGGNNSGNSGNSGKDEKGFEALISKLAGTDAPLNALTVASTAAGTAIETMDLSAQGAQVQIFALGEAAQLASTALGSIAASQAASAGLGPIGQSLAGAGGSTPPFFSGNWLTDLFGGAYAKGGDPPVGKVSIIGENGPEAFVPKVAGTIIPNHELKSMFGGFFAEGGSPPVGKVSIIGEKGPEIFVPKVAGTIVPNHELKHMFGGFFADGGDPPIGKMSIVGERGREIFMPKTLYPMSKSGGGSTTHNHYNSVTVNVPVNTSRKTSDQIALTTVNELQRAQGRK